KPSDAIRQKVNKTNELLEKFAGDNVKYKDIGKGFLAEGDVLTKEIMPDFLHLTPKGYQIWADSIKGELEEMTKKALEHFPCSRFAASHGERGWSGALAKARGKTGYWFTSLSQLLPAPRRSRALSPHRDSRRRRVGTSGRRPARAPANSRSAAAPR